MYTGEELKWHVNNNNNVFVCSITRVLGEFMNVKACKSSSPFILQGVFLFHCSLFCLRLSL